MISIPIVIMAVACLYYFSTRKFTHWREKNVAGPKPIPFFGNLKESALRRKHVGIVYKEIYDQFPNESVIGIYRMTNPTIIIRDLDVVKNVLIKDFEDFPDRGVYFSKEGLGDNIFHCDKNTWQAVRNRLTPLFTSKKIRNTFPLMEDHADRLVNYLQDVTAEKSEQEIYHHFKMYTMGTIMAAAYGIDVDFLNAKQEFVEKAGYLIFKSTYASEMDMLFPNILQKTNLSLYSDLVNKFSYEVVQMVTGQSKAVPKIRNDLMDVLIALKKENELEAARQCSEGKEVIGLDITEHVMAGQVFIFFAAGFGNNALSLSYAMFQLAKHQDVQDKLIKEIDDALEKYDGTLVYDALKEMTYLDKVLSEILRLNPLTNSIQRSAKNKCKIPNTDITVEKGTTVLISPYAIHRDSQLYPDPDKFDPERFSPENCANRHPCAYLPFGVGPRSCLGKQLAKLQFFVVVVKILLKFRIQPSEKTTKLEDYDPMCTLLATKGGVYVNIIPRK